MHLYLHNKQIEIRLQELANEINDAHEYDNDKVVMVGILTGGFMVFSEVIKHIKFPFECDFIRIKSLDHHNIPIYILLLPNKCSSRHQNT